MTLAELITDQARQYVELCARNGLPEDAQAHIAAAYMAGLTVCSDMLCQLDGQVTASLMNEAVRAVSAGIIEGYAKPGHVIVKKAPDAPDIPGFSIN